MFKKIRNNPVFYLAGRMWEFGAGRRTAIVFSMVMSAAAIAAWLLIPLVVAEFIRATQNAVTTADLWGCFWPLMGTVALGVLGWVFHGPARVGEMMSSLTVRGSMQRTLLRKTTRLPIRWHQSHHSGKTIDQISRASAALAEFTDTGTLVLQIFARFIGAIAMMALFMPSAGFFITANVAVALVIVTLFDRKLVPLYEKQSQVQNKVASKVQDYLTNIRTIISLRLEDRVVDDVDREQGHLRPVTESASITQEVKWFTANTLVDMTRAVTLFAFVLFTVRAGKRVELGILFALNEYLSTVSTAFFDMTWRWGDLVIKATRVRAIEHIEGDYNSLAMPSGRDALKPNWREIKVQGLSFRHVGDSAEHAGVFGVDLTLQRGKSYAIVGGSGSGKSTLLSLLRGLNTAEVDSVVCDGALVERGLPAIADVTTLVPQDPEVFADTVWKNVTMGIEASREKVLAALEMAGFTDVVTRLPRGLDTNIAEKGVSLSGGEKQRLALARGIFFAFDGESEIILLDESTSGVDVVRERRIYEALLRHFSRAVVVATTHKFNLLPLFDEILVMDNGRVIERGTLEGLLRASGRFATMWQEYAGAQNTQRVWV